MASTKTRRPVGQPSVVMSTPPPPSRSKSLFSEVEKQGLLQNFDLEVADKTQFFRSLLKHTLSSFSTRAESELVLIPRHLRGLTLGELESKWGGGWVGTMQRMRKESFDAREKVREEQEEKEREEVVKGKRKRNGTNTANSSPSRQTKNARRDVPTPQSARKAQPAASTSKTRPKASSSTTAAKRTKPVTSSSSTSKPPSSLPQNHIFNPSLPPTPFRSTHTIRTVASPLTRTSSPSRPRALSAASSTSSLPASESDVESNSASDSESDDLPDPEALEAKLLASKSTGGGGGGGRSPNSKSSKKKRGPSLIFRQSLAPGHQPPLPSSQHASDEPLASVELSDGRTISFNPFSLTPGRVERELEEGGVSLEEKKRVQSKVHAEVVKSLQARMEKWKV
ncbi:hypothetical protein CI109_102836 [Kwoniella shandongensis]|uniref:Uncharacterized protein n=1 Tax=Kwoniella shandongensis TaxID=1734106 RepID=A0A5M6CDI4_9TREE|nr:uncharacterized protein CI109_000027 [Kwoniella shandongensis]KAA5531189.1 hypothetical protein CI109_000027 [Kwoniella shandongensis]